MADTDRRALGGHQLRDLLTWLALVSVGMPAVLLTARYVALGTRAAPFLGHYRFAPSPWLLAAAAVAVGTVVTAWRAGRHSVDQGLGPPRFWVVQALAYLVGLAWTLLLGAGTAFGGRLDDTGAVSGGAWRYLVTFPRDHAEAAHGHPPGPALLVWALHQAGLTGPTSGAVVVTALGALGIPLLLGAARNLCGDLAARRYAPVLALAPSAVFL
ncbi:MAG: hypothetical protein WCA46_27115, partial [Actinocatenispora sp.]